MKKIFTSIIFAAAVFTGCNEQAIMPKGDGSFTVAVDGLSDQYITKSDVLDINTFDYFIDGEFRDYSGKVGEMEPVFENVPEGKYTITVSSPDKKPAAFEQPIISGSQEFEVKAGEITSVRVVCSIQNVKVSIQPTEEFFTELATYTVTVSNGEGAENKLIWTNEELQGANYASLTRENIGLAKPGYFTVSSALEIYVTGYRAATDQEAVYEGVITPVAAKDHFIIKLHAQTTGQLGGGAENPAVTLTIDYSTNDQYKEEFVPGFEDVPVEGPDDPSTGDGEDEDELVGLSLGWAANPDFGMYELKSAYDADEVTLVVNAENFINGFIVKIASPTEAFFNEVKAIAGSTIVDDYLVLDLMNPETAEAMSFLPTGDALRNKAQVDFPLSDLLPLICAFSPEVGSVHTFIMEVTDMKGQVLTQQLQFEYRGN